LVALRVEDIDLAADRELVERWQAGEHAVFDDLYRRYYGRLTSYCRKRVGDRDTAEEIAQEAFVKALQALPRFAGERRFYPWVTVIASRLCVDHHRRVGRVRPVEQLDPGSVDGDHGARLAFLADVDNLDRALQRLGPRHAEVLELRERRGMTYAQIAEHLEVPQSTVEALLFRARKALRREFFAVAGDGRMASLPIIGVVVRRLAAAKARAAAALPSLSQLGAPVAATAVAAVLSAAPFASSDAAPPVVASRPHVVNIATTIAPPAPVVASPTTPTTASSAPHVRQKVAAPTPVTPGVTTMSSHEARQSAATMPVLADLGSLGAGIDPTEVLGWLNLDQEDR
jgi:RNA polymerase sigma-70 factor (ECF subfamily)